MAVPANEFDITSRIVILVIMLLGAIFSTIAGIIFIYLFYKYFVHKNKKHNDEVYFIFGFYKVVEMLNAAITGMYLVTSCILYRIDESKMYGTFLLFWTSAFQTIISISRLIAIFVLGADKVCVILFDSRLNWKKRQLSILIGPALIIISTLFLFVYRILPNIPEEDEFLCPTFMCLTKYGYPGIYLDLKAIFVAGNFIVGIVLLILSQKNSSSKLQPYKTKCTDKLTIVILVLTFGFDLIPHVVGIIYQHVSSYTNNLLSISTYFQITSISLGAHLGSYNVMLTALESIFCGLFCIKMLSTKKIVVISSAVKTVRTVS